MSEFSAKVIAKLKSYVYRLIDPRNGETFYVGKGKGNRVFAHMKAEQIIDGEKDKDEESEEDDISLKLSRIREIRNAGLEVIHVIHRHGMDDDTAFEVEACLIDAIPGLSNVMGGTGSNDFGPMHATEIINRYSAQVAEIAHKAIFINVNISADEDISLYEATRKAWRMSIHRARKAELVLANYKGLIIGVFVPEKWYHSDLNGQSSKVSNRIAFEGREADAYLKKLYKGKQVPDSYRKKGAANPIKYTYK